MSQSSLIFLPFGWFKGGVVNTMHDHHQNLVSTKKCSSHTLQLWSSHHEWTCKIIQKKICGLKIDTQWASYWFMVLFKMCKMDLKQYSVLLYVHCTMVELLQWCLYVGTDHLKNMNPKSQFTVIELIREGVTKLFHKV